MDDEADDNRLLTEPGVHTFLMRDGDRMVEATLIVWPDGKSGHFSVDEG